MNELLTLKRNAIMLGLCGQYKDKWNNAKTIQDLEKLALDTNGIEFLADGIAFNWGLTKKFIIDNLGDNITIHHKEHGYSSQLIIGDKGIFTPHTTLLLAAWCNCSLNIKKTFVGKIIITGNSNVNIINNGGIAYIYAYGKNNINCNDKHNISIQHITASQWNKTKL